LEFFQGGTGARGHGDDMVDGARAYDRGLGQCPQQGPEAAALVKGSGDEAPEAESFEAFAHLKKAQKAVQGG